MTAAETPVVLAWHGNPELQERYMARVEAHRLADELVAGATGTGGKGCSVWCTFDAYDHSRGPTEVGIPAELFSLNDFVFESLATLADKSLHQLWPGRFLSAAKPGADLQLVFDRFQLWILTEEHPDRGEHCARIGALFQRRLNGDEPKPEEWYQAARAARDAWAARAARDARDARDASIQRMANKLIELIAAAPVLRP